MHDLSKRVSSNQALSAIEDLFTVDTYLVGGCVRDMLCGREPQDVDIVTFRDVEAFADRIAQRFSSTVFWMDEKRGVLRIMLRKKGITIDVSSPKGIDITADLKKRDITINAMAYAVSGHELIDPLGGLSDLDHGVIRIISEESLKDDPARVVRCLRFSVVLGFPVTASTMTALRKYAHKVSTVSPERIKQEFMKALCDTNGSRFFTLMETAGLIDAFFPDIVAGDKETALKGIRSALLLARETDGLIYSAKHLLPGSETALSQEVEAGFSREGLLRLAAFLFGLILHMDSDDIAVQQEFNPEQGIRAARELCSSLRFSSRAASFLHQMYGSLNLVHEIFKHKDLPVRQVHLLCEKASTCLGETLLLALAWKRSSCGFNKALLDHAGLLERTQGIWRHFIAVYQAQKQTTLVDGNDVIKALGISPGPMVARMLLEVEAARAEGVVASKEQAIEHLQELALTDTDTS